MEVKLWQKLLAEALGTAILVLLGCGTAVFIKGSELGALPLGIVGVALAFGLSIVATAYAIGHISGCHINPAVSLGMLLSGRMKIVEFCGYVVAQVIGAIGGAALLKYIISQTNLGAETGLGQNGFGQASMSGLSMGGAFITEVVLTLIFVFLVISVTKKDQFQAVAGWSIGGALMLVHLLGINLTGTSVNPARSFGPALLLGGEALSQVWVFLVAPLVGAIVAALLLKVLSTKKAS